MATKNRIDLHPQPGDALLIVDVPHDFLPGGVRLLLSILKSRNADRE